MSRFLYASIVSLISAGAVAAPVTFNVDPGHTYPSFEADHMGGLSIWRGKFTTTSGKIVLDQAAKTGNVNITVEVGSIDFGNPKLNEHAKSDQIFDVAKYPIASYAGKITKFNGDAPAVVDGMFTLHGVTKPLTLTIAQFLCKPNPMSKKLTCGADARATLNRSDYGVSFGADHGFKQEVNLLIQVEAIRAD